jgi:hypothetical protein
MATKTFLLNDAVAPGSNAGQLQDGGTVTDGDSVGPTGYSGTSQALGPGADFRQIYNALNASSSTHGTELSSAPRNSAEDCWRTVSQHPNGTYAAGTWAFTFTFNDNLTPLGVTDTGRFIVRLWKSVNADGSSATQLTSGNVKVSTAGGTIGSGAILTLTGSASLGAVTFSSEYLFLQVAFENDGTGLNDEAYSAWIYLGTTKSFFTTPNFTPAPVVITPTLVQHVSSNAEPEAGGNSGNDWAFWLPNPVGGNGGVTAGQPSGNCLVLAITYAYSATRTVTVTDNNGNTWPAPAVTVNDANQFHAAAAIYVLPNAKAGSTKITVSFDAALLHFSYTVSEFNNVATVSPVDATFSAYPTGPTVTASSGTPTQDGDLIYNFVSSSGDAFGHPVSQFTAGTGFALLDANIARGQGAGQAGQQHASQWLIQSMAAAIAPSMTAAQATHDDFPTVGVALKAASAGSPAPSVGIYVNRIHHFTDDIAPTTYKLQFPCDGTLLVLTAQEYSGFQCTAITDNKGNTWTRALGASGSGVPQIWRTTTPGGAITDSDLMLTFTLAVASSTVTILAYDVSGADVSSGDAYDGGVEDPGSNTGAAATATCPGFNGLNKLTPASANGLVIVAVGFGIGPAGSFAAGTPAGAVFDVVISTGQTDGSNMDNSDGRAHYYNPNLTPEAYSWNIYNGGPYPTNGGVDASFFGAAAHFKGQPVPPVDASSREPLAAFDPELVPRAWFDAEQIERRGWFDVELLGPVTVYETRGAFDAELVPRAWFDVEQIATLNWFDVEMRVSTSTTHSYTQSLSGTLTSAAGLVRLVGKLAAGTLTDSGALAKQTARALSGTLTDSGALLKQAQKPLAGTLTSSGALAAAKVALKVLAGTLTSSGTLLKQTQRALAGSLTSAGALVKQTQRALAGTLTSSGSLIKQAQKVLAGALTSAGALVKQTNKVLAGTMASAGALLKQLVRALAGTLTSSGSLIKQTQKVLAGTLTDSGTLTAIKAALKSIAGTLTSSGSLTKQAGKLAAGSLNSSGAIVKQTQKALAGALSSSGAIVKRTLRSLAGTLTSAGALAATKALTKAIAGTLTSAGALVKQGQKTLGGSISSSGAIVRFISHGISGTLSPVGSLVKRTARSLTGVLTSIGALIGIFRAPNVDNFLDPVVLIQSARAPIVLKPASRAPVALTQSARAPIILKTRS